eukprot:3573081-Rhodomonas_salina.1
MEEKERGRDRQRRGSGEGHGGADGEGERGSVWGVERGRIDRDCQRERRTMDATLTTTLTLTHRH